RDHWVRPIRHDIRRPQKRPGEKIATVGWGKQRNAVNPSLRRAAFLPLAHPAAGLAFAVTFLGPLLFGPRAFSPADHRGRISSKRLARAQAHARLAGENRRVAGSLAMTA